MLNANRKITDNAKALNGAGAAFARMCRFRGSLQMLRTAPFFTVLLLLGACDAAESPAEPGSAVAFSSDQLVLNSQISGSYQIFTLDPQSGVSQRLTEDDAYDHWWPRISPDRHRLLYYKAPVAAEQDYAFAELWETDPLGEQHRLLIGRSAHGWSLQAHAEWAPDGSELLMCAGINGNLHLTTTDDTGASPRQLTFDGHWNCDPSWSPDGGTVLFNRCDSAGCGGDKLPDLEIYTMTLATGQMRRLTYDSIADYDPYYSPDGKHIAWLRLQDPAAFGGGGGLVNFCDGSGRLTADSGR